MGNSPPAFLPTAKLGRLSLLEVRAIFKQYDSKACGALDGRDLERFVQHYLQAKNLPCVNLRQEVRKLLKQLDKNNDGKLSWQELAGVVYDKQGNQIVIEYSSLEDMGPFFGNLPTELRQMIVSYVFSPPNDNKLNPIFTLSLVCKTFCNDVNEICKSYFDNQTIESFNPEIMGPSGRVSLWCPHWIYSVVQSNYEHKPWIRSLDSYLTEMAHRKLRFIQFEDIFFITDGPEEDLKMTISLNGRSLTECNLINVERSFLFKTTKDTLYKEAVGEKEIDPVKLDPWFFDFFVNSHSQKNSRKLYHHQRYVSYLDNHRSEIKLTAERNTALIDACKQTNSKVFHPNFCQLSWHDLKSTSANSVVSISVHHGNFLLGTVSAQIGILGWILSEYPTNTFKNGAPTMDICWTKGIDPNPFKVDPDSLGCRYKIIAHHFVKEIT